MATNLRESGPPVVEDLFAYCYYYEFHQAVKLLELAFPKAHSLGAYAVPDQEALRIKSQHLFWVKSFLAPCTSTF